MHNRFLLDASVKALDPGDPRGAFEAIISVPTLDRDGEIVDVGAFNPLPASIPCHFAHDFRQPVGRGVPVYEGEALVLRGVFASTNRAQEVRQLVTDGTIQHMSVGFMPPDREEDEDGVTHIRRAELLEASFTSVPSNREAAILGAKSAEILDLAESYRQLKEAHDAFAKSLRESGDVFRLPDGETEKATATDPEQKAAAQAAADSPAEVPVDQAQAALALLDALTQGALA
jgi:HK97 family phage prohead protease